MTGRDTHPSPDERRASLEEATGPWQELTLGQALNRAAARYGARPFVMTDDKVWSYDDIARASRVLATRLIDLGIGPRDHVAMVLPNGAEFAIAKFALGRIGAVAVPINYNLRQTELSYILAQADCVALLTMDAFRGHDYLADLDTILPGWEGGPEVAEFPALKTVLVHPLDGPLRPGALPLMDPDWEPGEDRLSRLAAIEREANPTFRCDVLYTSGTTGHPKGAMVSHDMVMRTGYASSYALAREDERRILFALPMYHVFGYVECMIAAMFVGGAIVPRAIFDATDMLEAAERYAVGEIVCVPMMTLQMIEVVKERGFDCPSLVAFFNSGGINPDSIWQQIRDHFGARELLTGYGMTETTGSACCCLPEGEGAMLKTSNGRMKDAGLAGHPGPGGRLGVYKAVDPVSGDLLPPGEKGELLVRGYGVTLGYYKKPEEDEKAFTPDGWLRTGDVGTVDAEGYVTLMGRIKESYRCNGEMVMPEEVERFLKTLEGIEDAYVVGVPDPRAGEVGCAMVVPRGKAPDAETVAARCKDQIARFKIPKYVIEIEKADVPFTVTGRPRRFLLARLARERLSQLSEGTTDGAR